jgi:chromosome segregation ATPase
MASDSQLELRVSRLENDTHSIYDLIGEMRSTQQEHSQRFEQVDRRFDQVDQRFDQVDQRFEDIERQLGQIGTTLTEVVRRLPDRSPS